MSKTWDDIVVQWLRGWLASHKASDQSLNWNVEVASTEDAHLPNSPVNKLLLFSSCKHWIILKLFTLIFLLCIICILMQYLCWYYTNIWCLILLEGADFCEDEDDFDNGGFSVVGLLCSVSKAVRCLSNYLCYMSNSIRSISQSKKFLSAIIIMHLALVDDHFRVRNCVCGR